MTDNTDEEHLDNLTNTPSENPPDEITPTPGTETINSTQETENMEVHHHAHHGGKKNWKSYIWEFLMLFLAVFCGFLAEYQLEHVIEKDREKIYIENVLEDLKADTAIYNNYSKNNKLLFELIDTLIYLVKSPERKQHVAKLAYTARMILPKYKALYITDRTYDQMKNSGALRLIRSKQVANSISSYYYSVIDLKKYNDAAFTWGSDYAISMGKIFDGELLLKIIKENKEQPAEQDDLLTEDRTTLNELITRAQFLYGAFSLGEKIGNQRNIAAQNLILLIKNEYHPE
jgi:hypothetical protein